MLLRASRLGARCSPAEAPRAHILNGNGDREGLIHAYDVEHNGINMNDFAEASDGDPGPTFPRTDRTTAKHTKQNSQL